MITILRSILFLLLAPVFAIVAQAVGAVQDEDSEGVSNCVSSKGKIWIFK